MVHTIEHVGRAIEKVVNGHDIYSKSEVLFILRQILAEANKEHELAQEAGQIEQRLEEVAKSVCNHAVQVHKELVKTMLQEVEDHVESFDFVDYTEIDVNSNPQDGKIELEVVVTDELTDTLQTELVDLMFNPQTVTTFRRRLESLVFPAK